MLGHENLRVYNKSIELCAWTGELLDKLPKRMAVYDQLDRASTSVCLNIAEGSGKFTTKDQARFYDIARGSALECGACFDVIICRGCVAPSEVTSGKELVEVVVNMLVGLVRANDSGREY
jgi:four helix bundle protein